MPSDPLPPNNTPDKRKLALFILVCGLVLTAVAAYAVFVRVRQPTAATGGAASAPPVDPGRIAEARKQPHILFRITTLGPSYGRVGIVPLSDPAAPPVVAALDCDRVHASAANGLCLQARRGVLTTYRAIAFDAQLTERHSFNLAGAPSRTRVAPDAPFAASTVFVSGDSYSAGGFSTRTTIFDLRSLSVVGDLETFTVIRDGNPFKRPDFNFWGVTFAGGGDRFFATLGTAGDLHLVEGSIAGRTMTVVAPDVECPMLSPDGARIGYKARLIEGGRIVWRIRVLTLATKMVTTINDTRSVDDQIEWLDNDTVLYALPRQASSTASSDIWAASADGTGSPRVLIRDAFSPAVVRNGPESLAASR